MHKYGTPYITVVKKVICTKINVFKKEESLVVHKMRISAYGLSAVTEAEGVNSG